MIHESYLSRKRRDARAKQLKLEGCIVSVRSMRGQRLHPQYLQDAAQEGITYETGFGNQDYLRTWDSIYILEAR